MAEKPHTHMGAAGFEALVDQYYQPLYRFALSLTRNEAEAFDLAQQTFYLWAKKGHQLRDPSKVKSWLFTTLHREFLGIRRREDKFHHQELESAGQELPSIQPHVVEDMDAAEVLKSLMQVEDLYRAPLSLFYLEGHSYQEMAGILNVPIGTIMSRLSRGKQQLRRALADAYAGREGKIVSVAPETWRKNHG